ncbi:kynureninase-like isoform X6 [Tachypleus tridentatus]|uniref:kynureninase-like isoform X6 n=1 Tax=Tachypleus tridentatus TaxID=6853 RepID=UPI003FD52E92
MNTKTSSLTFVQLVYYRGRILVVCIFVLVTVQATLVSWQRSLPPKPTMSYPSEVLLKKAREWCCDPNSLTFAERLDQEDELAHFRDKFIIPKKVDLPYVDRSLITNIEEECIYLCGHSLGLQPKKTSSYVQQVLENWGKRGVHSHTDGFLPAAFCDLPPKEPMARLVGAKPEEIAIMNGLSVNLHILMTSFYKPTPDRHKILIEEYAFPSDMYAVKSQIALHEYPVDESLITLCPREGCLVAVDLAHAVGNVRLELHKWGVDFATWCTYKYLNTGPGGIGCIFVHKRHLNDGDDFVIPKLQGWWGNKIKTKFLMDKKFDPCDGADMFKLSNPAPLLSSTLMASLEIFEQTNMEELAAKQFLLTGYLDYLIDKCFISERSETSPYVKIVTPRDAHERGSQLSLTFDIPLNIVQKELQRRGIVCDIRLPSVIRVSPIVLYNSFVDVFRFVNVLKAVLQDPVLSKNISPNDVVENDGRVLE